MRVSRTRPARVSRSAAEVGLTGGIVGVVDHDHPGARVDQGGDVVPVRPVTGEGKAGWTHPTAHGFDCRTVGIIDGLEDDGLVPGPTKAG